jgi:hypothetical protein
MRTMLIGLLAAYSSVATVVAGRLDLAIIQFPEEKASANLRTFQKKVYTGSGPLPPRLATRAWCPADPRPVAEHCQGASKDGELSPEHRCRCAICSLEWQVNG